MQPDTRYAKNEGISIAYQVVGEASIDLVFVPGWVSHVEYAWEVPSFAAFLQRLASFARLIFIDRRGTGLSDRAVGLPTLEQRMDDVRAVLDAAGSERAALFGISEGGPMCTLFAATRPERTSALVLYGTIAAGRRDENYPWAARQEVLDRFLATIQDGWGKGVTPRLFAPTIAGDPQQVQLWARFERRAVSPGGMRSLLEMLVDTDVREILPTIHVPTLVLHRSNDRATPVEGGRYIAQRIPGAKYVELRGEDHFPWIGDADAILDEIEEFLTGIRHRGDADRVLATVMFCDIVGSTECATRVGDRAWRDVLERFYEIMRGQLELFRGSEVDTAGDGFFAAFDGPARAVWCARACQQAVSSLGLAVRVGIHTGECEIIAKKIGGIAVHIGARIGAMAGPNEVLVSGTVKDLVVGSGLRFGDRGLHTLKGIPGQWRLFAAQK